MSSYYPFGTGAAKSSISYAVSAVSASVPESAATLMPTAVFATSVTTSPAGGTSGISRTLTDCTGLGGTQGAQGARGVTGEAGTDRGPGGCPAGTKECTALSSSLAALNATLGPNNQFGVVCMDLEGKTAASLSCPGALPSGTPTLPVYTQ